jgi:NADPH-dependent glutamate synthase beta subunit-like oxidoreductase
MKIERTTPKTLTTDERRQSFSEVVTNLTPAQAQFEAYRCFYCWDAPCQKGCPADVEIPQFIWSIRSGNVAGAADRIYRANPLGSICGRVCPTEALCEKACTSKQVNIPIAIGHLQRYACDQRLAGGGPLFSYPPVSGGRVAIIGAGPAGLACAHFLRLAGHRVALFEPEEALGGLLAWGIPAYRLAPETTRAEVKAIAGGIAWHQEKVDAARAQVILQEFDAVFIGFGKGVPARLKIPGAELAGVRSAIQFLRDIAVGRGQFHDLADKEVGIIGGGATAMDAARCALRLGAGKATVFYRRTQQEMPAFASEYDAAAEEGVEFIWLAAPRAIEADQDRLLVQFEQMKLGQPDQSGRRSPVPTGSRFACKLDVLLEALPSEPDPTLMFLLDPNPKVFTGGDLAGGGTVVQAVADGKEAARKINQWLTQGGAR